MSLANLFQPNDYDIFCHSITPNTSGDGGVLTDNIDTVNFGDALNIGAVKAGSINIGSVASPVRINGNVTVPNQLLTNAIHANVVAGMTIGTGSTAINIISDVGDITIDQAAAGPYAVRIGDFAAQTVIISRPLGLTQIFSPLQLAGGLGTMVFFDEAVISGTGSGCIPNTAGFIQFKVQRINSIVRISWRPTASSVIATAGSPLTIVETLSASFRPFANTSSSTLVVGTSAAPLPVIAGTQLPGFISVTSAGAISFSFIPATHGSSNNWAIGETCTVVAGSMLYSTTA